MKFYSLAAALLLAMATPAFANADLAQKKNCMACHAVDAKRVGPAYKDVAAKYADNKDAASVLAAKVMKGGGRGVGAPFRCRRIRRSRTPKPSS